MEIRAYGWSRKDKTYRIAQADISKIKANENERFKLNEYIISTRADVKEDYEGQLNAVTIEWGTNLILSGNFHLIQEFNRRDIARLFRLAFGAVITEQILKKAKLTCRVRPTQDELRNAIEQMTVGEFLRALVGHSDKQSVAAA